MKWDDLLFKINRRNNWISAKKLSILYSIYPNVHCSEHSHQLLELSGTQQQLHDLPHMLTLRMYIHPIWRTRQRRLCIWFVYPFIYRLFIVNNIHILYLTLFIAFILAPLDMRYWATSKRPRKHALWSAVIKPSYWLKTPYF